MSLYVSRLFLLVFFTFTTGVVFGFGTSVSPPGESSIGEKNIRYSKFLNSARIGDIKEVVVIEGSLEEGGVLVGSHAKIGRFYTRFPNDSGLKYDLKRYGVRVSAQKKSEDSLLDIVMSWIPLLFLGGILVYFCLLKPQDRGSNLEDNPLGKSPARRSGEFMASKARLTDVKGIPEVMEDIVELVHLLKDPKRYSGINAIIPRGVLLIGPPGTGKTLIAKAIAGEARVPFYSVSGSDFVEMFVGVGSARIRSTFKMARSHNVSVIFIDEIDAVGRRRGSIPGSGGDEREQTLNQLLVEMDGMASGIDSETGRSDVVTLIIGATNRPDVLDPALLRPGRFDRQVEIPLPTLIGRAEIFELYLFHKGFVVAKNIDPYYCARKTPGFSGADIKNIVNEATLFAGKEGAHKTELRHIEIAIERIQTGPLRKAFVMNPSEIPVVALREAAYALVSSLVPNHDPLYKVSLLFRGVRWGNTTWTPTKETHLYSRERLRDTIVVHLAGYVAEKYFLREHRTTGSHAELKKAVSLAERMAREYGLFPEIGTITYKQEVTDFHESSMFGTEKYDAKSVNRRIDATVREYIFQCERMAAILLIINHTALLRIQNALLEHKELNGDEVSALIRGPALLEYK